MLSPPRLLLFAGPNGSGKSTVTTPERLAHFGIAPGRYINADDIARTLLAEGAGVTQEERERDAFRRARTLRATYREQGESFAFETVFSHSSTLLDMRKCREIGFEIVLFVVTTRDAEINVARVAGRYLAGGHDVPIDRIRSRYERMMRLLPRIVEDSDSAYVMDNSDTSQVFLFDRDDRYGGRDTLPPFLQERLAEPLAARRRERDAIARQFGATVPPDEEAGEYAGQIVWRGEQYAVQQTVTGSLRHDLLLFDAPPRNNETVAVHYKDNAAAV